MAAVTRFSATHGGEKPAHLAELLPYLKDGDKLAEIIRPAAMRMRQMLEHAGLLPPDPSQPQLSPNHPRILEQILRAAKITITEESSSLDWSWKANNSR